jgi:hypothetical protein
MALAFVPWKNMSDTFAGVPGGPVSVVPWGNHFALFATDSTGTVRCAGAYMQTGLMGIWAPFSDNFTTVPGAPITVLPWENRFALFATDQNGSVCYADGDPQNGLYGGWTNISDTFTGVPGGPVSVVPWGNHFALFATDSTGTVRCAGAYMQTGLMGTWAQVSTDFSGPPGAAVTAVPWAGQFAVCAVDSTGAVCTASGDPQNDLSAWTQVQPSGLVTKPGSAVTILAAGNGVDLFSLDSAGAVCATAGGAAVMTAFDPCRHGWHFDNDFVDVMLFGLIPASGMCGGMAYTSLDYYFLGMPIPTHRKGDFPDGLSYPPGGRLYSMIYNRLIDSFRDNFTKWSCVYPDLPAAIEAALGLVSGVSVGGILGGVLGGAAGGVVGGLLGGLGGWIYGELHEAFECPGGGAAGMTRKELPRLIGDFLDNGVPVPIGLIYNRNILDIGSSHQVVAYGYAVTGGQTLIYVYDNRYHDQVCILVVDNETQKIEETFSDTTTPLPGNPYWDGLLVEDGYKTKEPSYGQDLGVASPLAVTLDGKPVVMVPTAVDPSSLPQLAGGQHPERARAAGGSAAIPEGAVPILIVAQLPLPPAQRLDVSFSVQNYGEYQAHYQALGIEVDSPEGEQGPYYASAQATDNILQPDQTQPVAIDVVTFGDAPGRYYVKAGYKSAPTPDEGGPWYWLTFFYPPASMTVT